MRRITILVLLCLTLAGCGKPPTYWDGQLAEAKMEHGTVTSFVLDLGAGQSVGIFVTEDTRVESEVDILSPEAFLTAPRSGTGMVVYTAKDAKAAEMETESGERIDAFPARSIYLHTALSEETALLPDGSTAEVWKGDFGQEEYRLPDGAVLLRLDLAFRNGEKATCCPLLRRSGSAPIIRSGRCCGTRRRSWSGPMRLIWAEGMSRFPALFSSRS